MLFSSITFIYYFLPIVFALYFLLPNQLRNLVLALSSLFFYFYGEPQYIIILMISSGIDYIASHVIYRYRDTKRAVYALLCSLISNVFILCFFKYSDFLLTNINELLGTAFPLLHLPLPLGISFFTFQTMSYTIDVYKGEVMPQKSPLNFITYVSLFPQLVAGPIVRYQTIAHELDHRTHTWEDLSYGITRFVIGLGKKVIIANTLGELEQVAFAASNPSVLHYWLGIVSFTLQIYFDFSGYSDMAIGLGRIFGFHFLENFRYPFISKSITEFWQRWHISMGTWFREYLYIPLGGNRVSIRKWFRNIILVWFLTGLWHGASWNFIIWGLYFGIILIVEKVFLKHLLKNIPSLFCHAYVLLLVLLSFVIFHHESLSAITECFAAMFGLLPIPLISVESVYYLRSYFVILMIAVIGSTPLLKKVVHKMKDYHHIKLAIDLLHPIYCILILIIITAYLVDSSYNPFLYFRF